jgi:hypothetical protein
MQRNVSMTLRHLRNGFTVAWWLQCADLRPILGRVDPDLGSICWATTCAGSTMRSLRKVFKGPVGVPARRLNTSCQAVSFPGSWLTGSSTAKSNEHGGRLVDHRTREHSSKRVANIPNRLSTRQSTLRWMPMRQPVANGPPLTNTNAVCSMPWVRRNDREWRSGSPGKPAR